MIHLSSQGAGTYVVIQLHQREETDPFSIDLGTSTGGSIESVLNASGYIVHPRCISYAHYTFAQLLRKFPGAFQQDRVPWLRLTMALWSPSSFFDARHITERGYQLAVRLESSYRKAPHVPLDSLIKNMRTYGVDHSIRFHFVHNNETWAGRIFWYTPVPQRLFKIDPPNPYPYWGSFPAGLTADQMISLIERALKQDDPRMYEKAKGINTFILPAEDRTSLTAPFLRDPNTNRFHRPIGLSNVVFSFRGEMLYRPVETRYILNVSEKDLLI